MSRRDKIQSMLQESPDDVFLIYALAMEFSKESDVESALSAFGRVREIDPNYVPAYFQAGQLLAQEVRIEEAQAILKEGIQIARQNGDDHAFGEMSEFLESL